MRQMTSTPSEDVDIGDGIPTGTMKATANDGGTE